MPAETATTAACREQVVLARARQAARQGRCGTTTWNGRIEDAALHAACAASDRVLLLLEDLQRMHRLGTRARIRLLRIARTIADLADRERIAEEHVLEAAQLRGCGLEASC
jgi:magnesium chelatase family protein